MGGRNIVIRTPEVADGAAMYELARDSESLDLNSAYFYLLFCKRFTATSVVAEDVDQGRILGFIAGLIWPASPETVFVWQVGVDAAARGERLGSRMLDALADARGCRAVDHLESTVTPSNEASLALFRSFARRRSAPCNESPFLAAADFPTGKAHEPEILMRIGPFGSLPQTAAK